MADELIAPVPKRARLSFPLLEMLPEHRQFIWERLDYVTLAHVASSCKLLREQTKEYQVPRYLLPSFEMPSVANSGPGRFGHITIPVMTSTIARHCQQLIVDALDAIVGLHPHLKDVMPFAISTQGHPAGNVVFSLQYLWLDERYTISIILFSNIVHWYSRGKASNHCPRDEAVRSILLTQAGIK
jgi:hypothetical protein